MALLIFDALSLPFGLKKPERKLLEAAAILHDCGYFISYGSHHKPFYGWQMDLTAVEAP